MAQAVKLDPVLFKDYSDITLISSGGFGVVFKAIHIKTGIPVAIKAVHRMTLLPERTRKSFEQECSILDGLDHPFIVHLYEKLEDSSAVYLIMEYAGGGSILQRLQKGGPMKDTEIQRVFCEMMSAVTYLHYMMNVVHRDLKIDNVMLDDHSHVRIVDFGMSCILKDENETMSSRCGTLSYSAPEMLTKKPYTKAIDMWTIGIDLYAMTSGKLPFNDSNEALLRQQIAYEDPAISNKVTSSLHDLIVKLLQKDPAQRIEPKTVMDHPWISSSRYRFYLTDTFLTNSTYKAFPIEENEIDVHILSTVESYGFNAEHTKMALLSRSRNSATTCYLLLKQQRINEIIGSHTEIRSMVEYKRKNNMPVPPFQAKKAPTTSLIMKPIIYPRARSQAAKTHKQSAHIVQAPSRRSFKLMPTRIEFSSV